MELKFITEAAVNERRRLDLKAEGEQLETQILQFERQKEDLDTGIAQMQKRLEAVTKEYEKLPEPADTPPLPAGVPQ